MFTGIALGNHGCIPNAANLSAGLLQALRQYLTKKIRKSQLEQLKKNAFGWFLYNGT
jgi:hypothetical protein